MNCVVFDLDGTLCDVSHRRHHVTNRFNKNWEAFFAGIPADPRVDNVAQLYDRLVRTDPIFFFTGRPSTYFLQSLTWLQKNIDPNITHNQIRMRREDDTRPDHVVKMEMVEQVKQEGYEPWLFVDDRQSVVDTYRSHGYTVAQVAPGDFDPCVDFAPNGEHLLTLMVGPSGAGKSTYAASHYPAEWVISSDQIRGTFCGDFKDQSMNEYVFKALHALVSTRLRHGMKTVVDATHLHRKDRLAVVDLADPRTKVTYVVIDRPLVDKLKDGGWRLEIVKEGLTLIERHHNSFKSQLKDILKGDDRSNVIVKDNRQDA